MKIANFNVQINNIGNIEVFILHVMKEDSYCHDFDIDIESDIDAAQMECVLDLAEFVLYTMDRDCGDFSPMFVAEKLEGATRYYFFDEVFSPQIYPIIINGLKNILEYNEELWNIFDKSLEEYPGFFEDDYEEDIEDISQFSNAESSIYDNSSKSNVKNIYRLENLTQLYKIPHCKGRVFSSQIGNLYLETNKLMDDFLEKTTISDKLQTNEIINNTELLYEYE